VHPVRRLGEAARDRAPFAVKWGDTGDMPHRQQARTGLAVQADVASGVAELVADADRPRAWTLRVDGIPQSHVDLDDPEYLEFEYMRRLGHLADLAAPAGEPLRVLHLGGGGLTLARYVAATRPGSPQLAVDFDAALVDLVRRLLPLDQPGRRTAAGRAAAGRGGAARASAGPGGAGPGGAGPGGAGPGGARAARIRVRVGDARAVLEEVRAASFDLVIADLFAGARTPAHLTTVEFAAAAAAALGPAGIFAANLGDGPPLTHARARVATVRAVFPHAALIADPAVLRGRRFGNLVLAASGAELPVAGLARRTAGDPFPGRVVEGAELDRFAAGARPVVDGKAQASPAPPRDLFDVRR
jgi:spermidine synthase